MSASCSLVLVSITEQFFLFRWKTILVSRIVECLFFHYIYATAAGTMVCIGGDCLEVRNKWMELYIDLYVM